MKQNLIKNQESATVQSGKQNMYSASKTGLESDIFGRDNAVN